jgi:glycogen synthase
LAESEYISQGAHGTSREEMVVAGARSLRIVLLSLQFPPTIGGTSTFARALARGIGCRGHDVTVVVREGDVEVASAPYRLVRSPSFRDLIRLARGADVVHMNGFWLAGAMAASLARTPLVWTHHEYDTRCPIGLASYQGDFTSFSPVRCTRCMIDRGLGRKLPRRFAMVLVRRFVARLANANVSPSVHMGRSLALARSEILHYGLTSRSLKAPTAGSRKPRFVFAGRLIPEKGCQVLVEAAAECRRRGVEFLVEIYGDGPDREGLERAARSLRVHNMVLFKGPASQEEIVHQIAGSRGVVIPSIWQENSPLVAIESMSLGVAIIAARSGGLPETIGDGGIVVEQGNPVPLADALERLVENPDLASELGRLGRARFESDYTINAAATAHEELYRRIVGRPFV